MKRVVRLFLLLAIALPLSYAQSQAPKEDPIEALAGKWDVHCTEKGCMMFTDVLIGDPDHPADPKNPQYITIAVAINRSDRKPAFIAFDLPTTADHAQGVFIAFAKTLPDGKRWKMELDKTGSSHLSIDSCNDDYCRAVAVHGIVEATKDTPAVDLLQKFLDSSQILFLYTKNGVPYRTMKALFPFQRAYKQLLASDMQETPK